MGFFEEAVAGTYRASDDGKSVFRPWGVLGRGFSVPDPEQLRRLHRHVKIFVFTSLAILVFLALGAGPVWAFVAIPLLLIYYVVWVRRQARHLMPAGGPRTFHERYGGDSPANNTVLLVLLEVLSLVMTATSAGILMFSAGAWPIAAAATGVFGTGTIGFALMLIANRRARRKQKQDKDRR